MRKHKVSHLQKNAYDLFILCNDDDRKTGLLLDMNRSLKAFSGLVKWILRWLVVIWQSLRTIS